MIFCKINQELVDIIIKYSRNRTIIDCGCGEALLSTFVPDVISIDLMPPEHTFTNNIIQMNCVDFPFSSQHMPVFIRPCHSMMFVDSVLQKFKNVLTDCLYISKPENLEKDIDDEFKYEIYPDWVGEDGERIYKIKLYGGDKMSTFCLLEDERGQRYWAKDGLYDWYNWVGGRCPKGVSRKVIETVEANDFEDLDWNKTYLCDIRDSGTCGWLSREGVYYFCGYQDHDSVAYWVLKKEVRELEDTGWVRIYDKNSFVCHHRLSPEQRNWLSRNGYVLEDND